MREKKPTAEQFGPNKESGLKTAVELAMQETDKYTLASDSEKKRISSYSEFERKVEEYSQEGATATDPESKELAAQIKKGETAFDRVFDSVADKILTKPAGEKIRGSVVAGDKELVASVYEAQKNKKYPDESFFKSKGEADKFHSAYTRLLEFEKGVNGVLESAASGEASDKIYNKILEKIRLAEEKEKQKKEGKESDEKRIETLKREIALTRVDKETGQPVEGGYEQFSKPEDAKSAYEYFDPKEELENIGKFTAEELAEYDTPEKRIALKKERMEAFKERLAEQKVWLGQLNTEIEEALHGKSGIDREKLKGILIEKAEKAAMSPSQVRGYLFLFDQIEKHAGEVKSFRDGHKGKSGEEVFEELYGTKPVGGVKIEFTPMAVSVVCKNNEDYATARTGKGISGRVVEKADIEEAQKSRGFFGEETKLGANSFVTISREEGAKKGELKAIKSHEERHVINKIAQRVQGDIDHWRSRFLRGSSAAKEASQTNQERAKDEILAYLVSGTSPGEIIVTLSKREADGGLYDYYPMVEEKGKDGKVRDKNAEARKEHEAKIIAGCQVVETLLTMGMDKSYVAGLFQAEALDNWGKVIERIKRDPNFQTRREKAFKITKDQVDEGSRLALEAQEDLDKNTKLSATALFLKRALRGSGMALRTDVRTPEQLKKFIGETLDATQIKRGVLNRLAELK